MKQYSKPQVAQVEINATERIANCVIGSVPPDLPPWMEIEDQDAMES